VLQLLEAAEVVDDMVEHQEVLAEAVLVAKRTDLVAAVAAALVAGVAAVAGLTKTMAITVVEAAVQVLLR
jgi:VIT1/CCC1 family predicted Fe2+/Mn2+ transporter